MTDNKLSSRWMRLGVIMLGIAVVSMLLSAGGEAKVKPGGPGKSSQVSVVTLTAGPVTITTPGELYPLFSPPATFTQLPGEVVTVTMGASFDMPDPTGLFCDLHTAVFLPNASSDEDTPISMRQNTLAQRGDDWWNLTEQSRDLTRTIPAPEVATEHTLMGVTWMDLPGLLGPPPEDPNDDPGDCYGTNYEGFEYQVVTAGVRVSVVKMTS
jgi:hypothetical protein